MNCNTGFAQINMQGDTIAVFPQEIVQPAVPDSPLPWPAVPPLLWSRLARLGASWEHSLLIPAVELCPAEG
jgi:hypothetical protein